MQPLGQWSKLFDGVACLCVNKTALELWRHSLATPSYEWNARSVGATTQFFACPVWNCLIILIEMRLNVRITCNHYSIMFVYIYTLKYIYICNVYLILFQKNTFIYMHMRTRTHAHTFTHTYIYICVCVYTLFMQLRVGMSCSVCCSIHCNSFLTLLTLNHKKCMIALLGFNMF